MEEDKDVVRKMFSMAITAVLPHLCLRKLMHFEDEQLRVEGKTYNVGGKGCHVIGFGKAVIGMAAEVQRILGPKSIKSMILSVPHGICDHLVASGQNEQLPQYQENLFIIEGARNNLPDADSLRASKMIEESLKNLHEEHLVIVLISGGGSALLPAPIHPLTLEDKNALTHQLMRAGATIQDLNAIRIQLSSLKGGKLAKLAKPAQVVAFILSDIIDDPLELIASGPTVFNPQVEDASSILHKFGIEVDGKVKAVLSAKPAELHDAQDFSHVQNILVGTNKVALEACHEYASLLDFNVHVLTSSLAGEAKAIGALIGSLAFYASHSSPRIDSVKDILQTLCPQPTSVEITMAWIMDLKKPLCLLFGGETTVKVCGTGQGGRNQEMVLSAMLEYHILSSQSDLPKKATVTFLSAGTDGIDGPTNAAGAIANEDMCMTAREQGLDPMSYLLNNDSNNFFTYLSNGENLVMTGHTGTNVMDIQILLITPI